MRSSSKTKNTSADADSSYIAIEEKHDKRGAQGRDRRRSQYSERAKKEERTGWLFMAPFLAFFTLLFIFPLLYALWSSFFTDVSSGGGAFGGGELVKKFVGFDNFEYVVTSKDFWLGVGRVAFYMIVQVPVMLIAALVLALIIDSMIIKRVGGFRLFYFLPYAIPGVVAAIVWTYLYNPSFSPIIKGLEHIGIHLDLFADGINIIAMANISTWSHTGYNMLIFLAALQAIPTELYEAARLDGCNAFQVATRVKIPNIRGAVLLTALLSIIGTMQLFNEPQVMQTSDPGINNAFTPLMMAYNTMKGGLSPQGDGLASAMSIVIALIAGVLAVGYFFADRKVSSKYD